MSGSLTEELKLRCPLSECRSIVLPTGTDLTTVQTAHVVPAGAVLCVGGVVCMSLEEITVTAAAELTTAPTVWLTFAPKVIVTKTDSQAWPLGQPVYHDEDDDCETFDIAKDTTLKAIGYVLEAVANTAGLTEGLICFQGDCLNSETGACTGTA